MSKKKLDRLFKPGLGAVPPYLAGRKREQEFFQRCVRALKKRILNRPGFVGGSLS